jgi:hypothetical protein
VGLDGRLYVVQNNTTYRSDRKAVLVPASLAMAEARSYRALPGILEHGGTPAIVSEHVRMGTPPWQTNVRAPF